MNKPRWGAQRRTRTDRPLGAGVPALRRGARSPLCAKSLGAESLGAESLGDESLGDESLGVARASFLHEVRRRLED